MYYYKVDESFDQVFKKKNIITFSGYFPGQAVSVNGLMADLFVLSDFRIIGFR